MRTMKKHLLAKALIFIDIVTRRNDQHFLKFKRNCVNLGTNQMLITGMEGVG